MMGIQTLAHGARQNLARALEALQAVDAPPALLEAAQPVARAMGELAELESLAPAGTADRALLAVEALRESLRLLQLPQHVEQPATERAMAAVAETLGEVVELARRLEATAASSAPADAAPGAAPANLKATLRGQLGLEHELRAVDAALGAHSASNFYRGLCAGDIVTSGGLFVATYQLPRVGEQVLLKVSMPGGYEFAARAIVAWTRDASDASDAPEGSAAAPGFGARFSEITDEGRGLIQRYARNREPLFHDDP